MDKITLYTTALITLIQVVAAAIQGVKKILADLRAAK